MDLAEVRARALAVYKSTLSLADSRHEATKVRDRLRKLSPSGGEAALPPESAADWQWHRENQQGFDRLTFELQREEVLGITGPRGVDGYAAARAAGFILLDWLGSTGAEITAMKFGTSSGDPGPDDNLYLPSYAVDFLAQQLVDLDPALDREDTRRPGSNLALDTANRVVRLYLQSRSG